MKPEQVVIETFNTFNARCGGTNRLHEVVVHVDGSCYPNPGPGGWAFVAEFNGRTITHCGHQRKTTNQVMELAAAIAALQRLPLTTHPLRVVTDSEYVKHAMTERGVKWKANGWITSSGKPVANLSHIKQLVSLCEEHRRVRTLTVEWVKGHTGHSGNECVDRLAGKARALRWNRQST